MTGELLLMSLLGLVLLWAVIFTAVVAGIREAQKPAKSKEERQAARAARPWYAR